MHKQEPTTLEQWISEKKSSWKQSLRFYDTKQRKVIPFTPIKAPHVHLYTCGPTVYDVPHIGNLRTFIFEDLLARVIDFTGYQCRQVMNITDVDDKTIKRSIEKNVPLKEYTSEMTERFFEDLEALCVRPAASYPRATDYIQEMETMICTLLDKGLAYKGDDQSIYFKIAAYPEYGNLSGRTIEDSSASACCREADEYEDLRDFVLWKAYDCDRDGPVFWESSALGKGRPGWHIECSAMAHALLGETLDIHTGGSDNLFPHHENEAAQSFGCFGKQLSRYWLHAAHLLVEGKKMAKSEGNFTTWRDLKEQGYSGQEVRYLLAKTHYRHSLNFTKQGLLDARASLERIYSVRKRVQQAQICEAVEDAAASALQKTLRLQTGALVEPLLDDLNVSSSLAAIFDLVRELNSFLDQSSDYLTEALLADIKSFFDVYDFLFSLEEPQQEMDAQVLELAKQRLQARQAKDYQRADALREQIDQLGYLVEDGKEGKITVKKIR